LQVKIGAIVKPVDGDYNDETKQAVGDDKSSCFVSNSLVDLMKHNHDPAIYSGMFSRNSGTEITCVQLSASVCFHKVLSLH
jgi:hypothetical protein